MRKIKIIIRYYFSIFIYLLRLTSFQRQKSNSLINIINFHYFIDNDDKIVDNTVEVSLKTFETQIKVLLDSFKIISEYSNLSFLFDDGELIKKISRSPINKKLLSKRKFKTIEDFQNKDTAEKIETIDQIVNNLKSII